MPFRKVASHVAVDPRPRTRATPPAPAVREDLTLVTYAVNVQVNDPVKLYAVTQAVGIARKYEPGLVEARVVRDGNVDIGECVKLLLEESLAALAATSGCVIGEAETYLDFSSFGLEPSTEA